MTHELEEHKTKRVSSLPFDTPRTQSRLSVVMLPTPAEGESECEYGDEDDGTMEKKDVLDERQPHEAGDIDVKSSAQSVPYFGDHTIYEGEEDSEETRDQVKDNATRQQRTPS